jgi:hypothetical protein
VRDVAAESVLDCLKPLRITQESKREKMKEREKTKRKRERKERADGRKRNE